MRDSSTILLVDDEDSVQKLLTYPLERDGFRVVQARDGEQALRLFGELYDIERELAGGNAAQPKPNDEHLFIIQADHCTRLANLECAQCQDRAQDTKNIKTGDHLGFGPSFLLEMMMERRHAEDPLAGQLEACHLDDD